MECTWKIEWERSVLKILTFWSRSKAYLVKTFFFSLSFFFFFFLQAVRTGSGFQVGPGQTGSRRWRHPWRHGTECACQSLACDSAWTSCQRVRSYGCAWERVEFMLVIAGHSGWAWRCVHDLLSLKFSGFVDRGTLDRVAVYVFWIGGLIYTEVKEEATIFRSLWWRVEARGLASGPEIFRFGRSWADGLSGCISFVKFFSDLHRFEWEIRGSLEICGRAWWCVMAPLLKIFLSFVH